jgi:diguanylate cyclase (GGDEF)-like protein
MANYEDEHMRLIETVSRIAADAIAKSLQHAQAETYALTDPMTGLPNARSLQMHFDKELKRASRNGETFQVLMLDLDGFKAVNDTYGHKVGDRMLKDVSAIIRAELRDYDFLARYAGDEFVAIVPQTDSHGVLELCRRIEAAVKGFTLSIGGETARVGVSVGSACYPNHGESFDQILIAADKAMYLTKAVHKQRSELTKWADSPAERGPALRATPSGSVSAYQNEKEPVKILTPDDGLIVELDESHIVSSAVN